MRSLIALEKSTAPQATILDASEAATIIQSYPTPTAHQITAMTNKNEPLLAWFKIGDIVEVTPDDTGRVPQRGELIGIDSERIVLRVQGENGGNVLCHFPRLGFGIGKVKVSKI